MVRAKRFGENLTTKQIISMDIKEFNKLNASDLSKLVSRIASTANKSIKRVEKEIVKYDTRYKSTGLKARGPAAYAQAIESKPKDQKNVFGLGRGPKELSELRKEFIRIRNYLQAETSTVKGIRKARQRTMQKLKAQGINIGTEAEMQDLIMEYEQLKHDYPNIADQAFKYDVLKVLSENREARAQDMRDMMGKVRNEYEQRERDYNTGVSEFFIDEEDI